MTILRVTCKVMCDTCRKLKMFIKTTPQLHREDADEGWLFSEQEDLCPECLKAKWK